MPHSNPDKPANTTSYQIIEKDSDLVHVCEQLQPHPVLAVDTEFIRDKTYYPVLCLIQLAASEELVYCIDPLSVSDLTPLKQVLYNPDTCLVFHAARQDLEIFFHSWQALPQNIFDTQVAAGLLGLGEQIGYANLVKHYLGISLNKGHSRTDWQQRPLSNAQLDYAADDVRYLIKMYPQILEQLHQQERSEWLKYDFQQLTDAGRYSIDLDTVWQRISGQQKLKGRALFLLQQLAKWREQQAMQQNLPRKWIMPDHILLSIAVQTPADRQKLQKIRGISQELVTRHADTILALVKQSQESDSSRWPQREKYIVLNKQQEALVDVLMAIIRLAAAQHNINITALATRKELEKIAGGEAVHKVFAGWRENIIGTLLQDFLDGDISICHSNTGLLLNR